MVKTAVLVLEWNPRDNKCIHRSPDKQYIRMSIKTYEEGTAEKVLVDQEEIVQMPLTAKHEALLSQVSQEVWSKHKTDVGLVMSAQPIHIKLKPGVCLPFQWQYPLKQHAVDGIKPTIEWLLKAGVLAKTNSPCDTPIFPVKKANSTDYRLVQDLRPVNSIVEAGTPVVPDPHTLLSNIPPDTKWYTGTDLCSAFFSVPLHPDSQHLFAFTYQGQKYTYTMLPQSYEDSYEDRVLAQDLQHLDVTSTVIQYMDDLLLCAKTKEQCERNSVTLLTILATGGHKVSRDELQFC